MQEISFCGINCLKCPAYIAKRTNDNELRKRTAMEWGSVGFVIDPEKISCDGCHSNGELLMHCSDCKVRNCGLKKGVKTCAECPDYACNDLEELWTNLHAPEAKVQLDNLR
ncbi:hypothetical protein NEF87_002384 [Candidatus Lokiarchaeum ossiferum]|uniref:DUF3795 domain-containing protein n=1 Tax=Candidatus Lokiarchaeum ossiferum TaxID=2951803 RepID=A0ABY6HU77_9ARCH|nr:hypothetical protein NEF87_002384 [Candidatus Lokiarchaeum sp. B-35]